jgi:hypothetical protein
VRRVRMLGLGLVAVLAIAAVGASPALAGKKAGELSGEWAVYKGCPLNTESAGGKILQKVEETGEYDGFHAEEFYCFNGETESGFFKVGKVKTLLSAPVRLQGLVVFHPSAGNPGESGIEGSIIPTETGYETLESPPLPISGGINKFRPFVSSWPEALQKKFHHAIMHGETGLTAKIEVAGGNRIFEQIATLSTENILNEKGTAFELPLKVKISGTFLSELQNGQNTCHVGSESDPPVQHLTDGISVSPFNPREKLKGAAGEFHANKEFTSIELAHSRLVDNTWEVATGAEECGGEYSQYIEQALNEELELPAPAGKSKTELVGSLHTGLYQAAEENFLEEEGSPLVTLQPKSVTATEGQPASFSSESSRHRVPGATVQWEVSTNGGVTFEEIPGATGNTYTIESTKTSESGNEYEAVFKNSLGEATSEAATLTVNPPES